MVNLGTESHDVYIGRTREEFHFGNPFSHKPDSLGVYLVDNREDSIVMFRKWLVDDLFPEIEPERRQWIIDNKEMLRGKRLGCFCKPKSCHGDVYLEILGESDGLDNFF